MRDKSLEHHFPDAIAEVKGFAIFMLDPGGIIQTWNKGCELLKGYTAAEAIGQNFDMLFPDFLRAQHLPEKERSLAKETGRYESENWRRKKNGDLFWAFVVLTRVLDEEGNHIGFIKITQDETDKKHYLEQLNIKMEEARNINVRLDKINKELLKSNNRLGEFAYASSHDLQAPLRKISVYIDLLKNDLREQINDHHKKLFGRIRNSIDRMVALTENLLTFSYISTGTGEIADINLNEQVDEVLEDLELDILEKKANFSVKELPKIRGDKRQFQQLFQNLISNAIKYTKPNVAPEIEISSYVVTGSETKKPLPAEAAGKQFHLIQLKDNGIGFEQEFADNIFELFTRLPAHSSYAGSGVGLSIVRKVVENHHGLVWAESKPGEGAIFKILLPA
jgi:PAS domain S-box-containing protein